MKHITATLRPDRDQVELRTPGGEEGGGIIHLLTFEEAQELCGDLAAASIALKHRMNRERAFEDRVLGVRTREDGFLELCEPDQTAIDRLAEADRVYQVQQDAWERAGEEQQP